MWKIQKTVFCIKFTTFLQKDSELKLFKTINKDILYYLKQTNEGFSISQR